MRSADVIGPEPELLDLVWERYEEAVKGDLRMNCDSCVYRIALPGFEDKVGLPQQPHFHPDDDGDHHHQHITGMDTHIPMHTEAGSGGGWGSGPDTAPGTRRCATPVRRWWTSR
ncbi:hypothetical protein SVIOM342S_02175 [Streptomyces violaceorubidus]